MWFLKQYFSSRIPYADKITPEPILNNNAGRDTKADSIRNSYNSQFKVGIYGWRKKCLYILVMALMLMLIINLALTLWVLKVLDFNSVNLTFILLECVVVFIFCIPFVYTSSEYLYDLFIFNKYLRFYLVFVYYCLYK